VRAGRGEEASSFTDQRVVKQGLPSQNWIGARFLPGDLGKIVTKMRLPKKLLIKLAGGEWVGDCAGSGQRFDDDVVVGVDAQP
jgi:hypothetical protein